MLECLKGPIRNVFGPGRNSRYGVLAQNMPRPNRAHSQKLTLLLSMLEGSIWGSK